ncbi:MAG: response regulator transcription factor [Chloroflexi bacterium]|nr:response regulator transcription factor [Chloroflexota bacterium]
MSGGCKEYNPRNSRSPMRRPLRAPHPAGSPAGSAMSGNVLIIEDDARIAEWVRLYFDRAGYSAQVAHDGRTGLNMARGLRPDLVILDLTLPRLDGVELCRILRRESDVPIIMLTAREAPAQRIVGLESGADDYIVKPFDPREVIARSAAVLRRVQGKVQQVLTCGSVSLNETTGTVTVDDESVELSRALIALLSTFMRHPNQVLTRDQLIALTMQHGFDGFDRAIDSQVARLRKQIGRDGAQPIQTVYGAGYRFVVEDD